MNVYIYAASLYCQECGEKIREDLRVQGKAPDNPQDEYTYDSDDYPKGPYPDGGGEADSFNHCGNYECEEFLDNPLTEEGVTYTIGSLRGYIEHRSGRSEILDQWADSLQWYGLNSRGQIVLDYYFMLRGEEGDS